MNSARQASVSPDLIVTRKRDLEYSSLKWSACQSLSEQSNPDVLSCWAVAGTRWQRGPNFSASITETIAACG